jgi:hypothetical protein
MKGPAKNKTKTKSHHKVGDDAWRALKHDINNQLSNILLALEQLRYEIPEATEDCAFYIESIPLSTKKINSLLKETD